MELGGGQRAGQGGVRVAVDQDPVRLLLEQHLLEPLQHLRGLPAVRGGADAEVIVGRRQVELVEEDIGELLVVVLAGVDEHLLMGAAQVRG